MFTKINYKLRLGISLFVVLVILIENILIFSFVYKITSKNFENLTKESVEISYNNLDAYLSLSTNLVELVLANDEFMRQVSNNEYSLNSLKIPSLGIIGVILYNLNGGYYYSDGMGGIQSLNSLTQDYEISSFIQDDSRKSIFLARNHYIPLNYVTNILYDSNQGIISYITKVLDEEQNICGYLFIDISPRNIYQDFFSYKKYQNMQDTITIIETSDNDFLKTPQNKDYKNSLDDKNYLIYTNENLLNITTLVPMNNFKTKILQIYLPILLWSIIIVALAIFCSITSAKKIVCSLRKLNMKMNYVDEIIKEDADGKRNL